MSFFVTILQSRGPIFQLLLIYLIICTIPLGVGCYLLVAPLRGGNFLNGAFAVFPPVGPKDALKKLFYRAMGVGLILVSAFYIHQVQLNILGPVVHFIRVGR